jgi:four helix bundle protein
VGYKFSLWRKVKSLQHFLIQRPLAKDQRLRIMRNYKELDVWKVAIDFVKKIYGETTSFPRSEKYGIVSQIAIASVSISINIAEGCSRKTAKDFARFLEISIGSCFEVETLIIKSTKLNYISIDNSKVLIEEIQTLQRGINALRTSILKSS